MILRDFNHFERGLQKCGAIKLSESFAVVPSGVQKGGPAMNKLNKR